MGICEILTIIFVVCKLLGVIGWTWFYVLLPEIIAFALYIVIIGVILYSHHSLKKSVTKHFDHWDDFD